MFSAYLKYSKSKKLQVELVDVTDSKVVAEITGKRAWKSFEHEAGKHVVQRVPPSESGGRRHTSVVCVAVMPLREPKQYSPLDLKDINMTFARGQGPGGQKRNVTASAVRVVHTPTKIQVVIDGRDQHKNRREALRILTARVREQEWSEKDKSYNEKRKAQMDGGGRGNKIRTYNFIDKFVIDHRTGKETRKIKKVMKGHFELVL